MMTAAYYLCSELCGNSGMVDNVIPQINSTVGVKWGQPNAVDSQRLQVWQFFTNPLDEKKCIDQLPKTSYHLITFNIP